MAAVAGLYRRLLPAPAIDFTCHEGKQIFREALEAGTMEGFFKLIAHFQTQAEPAFCGLASLAVVLNSLAIDPGRTWKGPWRWFDETMLDCCEPLERVKEQGISFAKVACLGECSGARVEAFRSNESRVEDFRQLLKDCCSSEDKHLIASYNRQLLKQTGTGHFSPVGGYHRERDLALILDVARFKYPPHWVPVTVLFDAMNTVDVSTGKSRGFMVVTKRSQPASLLFTSSCKVDNWRDVSKYLSHGLVSVFHSATYMKTIEDVFLVVLESFPGTVTGFIKWIVEVRRSSSGVSTLNPEELERLERKAEVLHHLRSTKLFKKLSEWLRNTRCSPCSLSCSSISLTHEIGEACCQASAVLGGGEFGAVAETSFTCKKLTQLTGTSEALVISAAGVGTKSSDNIQVIVPATGSESSSTCFMLHPTPADVFTVLLFAQPVETWLEIQNPLLSSDFSSLASTHTLPPPLQDEIQHLQRQLRVLNCSED